MYGMPTDLSPTGFDTSMLLMSGYLLGGLAVLILFAMIMGIITLPTFFLTLWNLELAADETRMFLRWASIVACGTVSLSCFGLHSVLVLAPPPIGAMAGL